MKNSKLFLIGIISMLSGYCYSQYTPEDVPQWNNPRTVVYLDSKSSPLPTVVNDTKQFTYDPRFNITPNGTYVVYPNIRVHPTSVTQQSEVPITRSPANHLILFGSSNAARTSGTPYINSGTYRSTDGGLTWSGTDSIGTLSVANQRGDPGPTIDKNGVWIFTHLTSTTAFSGVTGMGANRSTDNGITWSATVQVVNDGGADKNLAGTDDFPTSPFYGNSYFAWTSFSTSPANSKFSRTTDGGTSWSAQITINTTPSGHNAQGHDVAVAPNGNVFVCWTAGNSGSPFTEDFVGVAKSTNGGLNFTATENAFDVNGSRSSSFNGWGIRTNGFPRIAIDKTTCGARSGWIYIVSSEINHTPAGTDADVVFHRSTNNGTTWSSGIRVNQDALNNGKVQWFPAICVDESGAINVVYYDNRNFPSVGDSCSVFISRSLDGGTTWTDIEVADHHFKPKGSTGFSGGYMGDYIGITASVGKVVALWSDDKAGVAGFFNAWSGSISMLISTICEDFSCTEFPNSAVMTEEFSGTNYWSKQTQSAYGIGSGSARFNSWNAALGTSQSLITYDLSPTVANQYLTFDEAYAPWSGGNVDSLLIETSSNSGTSYTFLAKLWGGLGVQAGPLNTVFVGGGEFTPANNQWASKIYTLPLGTNKIKIRARSGFGNDIWLDNVCIKTLAAPVANSIGIVPDGYYNPSPPSALAPDTVRVYLRRLDFPNISVDSAIAVFNTGGIASPLNFNNALTGTYYKVVRHRNCIETWSKAGGESYTRGTNVHFNFINPAGQAYLNNQRFMDPAGPYYGMFSGDCNLDSIIDVGDLTLINNDLLLLTSGYVVTDLNGDLFVDASDLIIAYNNVLLIAQRIAPPGAEPTPPVFNNDQTVFENDADRKKYEDTKKMLRETPTQTNTKSSVKESDRESYEMYKRVIEESIKHYRENKKEATNIPSANSSGILGMPR